MQLSELISIAQKPPTYTVCGVNLLPFSLGHQFHLERCGVSFVTGSRHELGDLRLAIAICSHTAEGFSEIVARDGLRSWMFSWHRYLSGGHVGWMKRAIKRATGKYVLPDEVLGFNLVSSIVAFERYMCDHGGGNYRTTEWGRPRSMFKVSPKAQERLYAPELRVLADSLLTELALNESVVMNMPLCEARWRWAIHTERKGWSRLVDRKEQEADQAMADAAAASVPADQWYIPRAEAAK